jgi:hypothetical protein
VEVRGDWATWVDGLIAMVVILSALVAALLSMVMLQVRTKSCATDLFSDEEKNEGFFFLSTPPCR